MLYNVLVAGFDAEPNPITRLVTEYNGVAVHVAENSNKQIPNCDAAIIATTNAGHALMDRVKAAYKDKHIFYANGGRSSIEEEFRQVFVDPIAELFNSAPPARVIGWFVCHFYDRGDKVTKGGLYGRLGIYTKENIDTLYSNSTCFLKKKAILESRGVGKGFLRTASYDYPHADAFQPYPFKEFLRIRDEVKSEPLELVTEQPLMESTVPVAFPEEVDIPEVKSEAIPPQVLPAKSEETADAVELLLEAMTSLDTKLSRTIMAIAAVEDRVRSVENRIDKLANVLGKTPGLLDLESKEITQLTDILGKLQGLRVGTCPKALTPPA